MSDNLTRRSILPAAILALPRSAAAQPGPSTGAATLAFDVRRYGVSPGSAMNTAAFERAFSACSASGGGTVFVPAGVYVTGPIRIPSRATLYLDAGAMLKGSPTLTDYPLERDPVSGESGRAGLVTARDAENVAIEGRGVIDGNSMPFHDASGWKAGEDYDKKYTRQKQDYMDRRFGTEHGPLPHGERPGNLVRFVNCRNVRLTGITIQNSPTWTTLIHQCTDVELSGLNINSLGSGRRIPNDDGVDVRESQYVRITGCHIEVGDDCIALFGSRNVVASACTMLSRSAGVRVGYMEGDTRDCVFQNLVIDSHCGLKVNVRGAGSVENVMFSDIVMRTGLITGHWWGAGEPIHVSAAHGPGASGMLGRIRNIRFSNISAESEAGIVLWGSEDSVLRDIAFDEVDVAVRNGPLAASYGGNFDVRGTGDFSEGLFEHDIPGLFFRHIEGLSVRGLKLKWAGDVAAFFSNAIYGERFRDVEIRDFCGRQAHADAAIRLRDGARISIRDCRAAPGASAFVDCENVSDQRMFVGNDLADAKAAGRGHAWAQVVGNIAPRGGPAG